LNSPSKDKIIQSDNTNNNIKSKLISDSNQIDKPSLNGSSNINNIIGDMNNLKNRNIKSLLEKASKNHFNNNIDINRKNDKDKVRQITKYLYFSI